MYSRQVYIFIQTAELGSFTKAAEQLYVTPSAVIKQINSLEDHLGFSLIKRTHRGITLTPAGNSIYNSAKQLIRFSDQAVEEARALSAHNEYTIRVGSSLLFPSKTLVNVWSVLGRQYPFFKLKMVPVEDFYSPDSNLFSCRGREYDVVLGPIDSLTMLGQANAVHLGEYSCHVGVPHNKPLATLGRKLELSDLYGETLLTVKEDDAPSIQKLRQMIKRDHPKINLIETSVHYTMDTFNYCVDHNILLLSYATWSNIHPGMVTLSVNWDYKSPCRLLYSKTPSKAVRKFVEILQEYPPLSL